MKCNDCVVLLDEYQNDLLEQNLKNQVSNHLEDCEDCRTEIFLLSQEMQIFQTYDKSQDTLFKNSWETFRARLIEESIIKSEPEIESATLTSTNRSSNYSFFDNLKNFFNLRLVTVTTSIFLISGILSLIWLKNFSDSETPTIAKNSELTSLITPKVEDHSELKESLVDEISDEKTDSIKDKFIKSSSKNRTIFFKTNQPKRIHTTKLRKAKFTSKKNTESLSKFLNSKVDSSAENNQVKTHIINANSVENNEQLVRHLNTVQMFLITFRNVKQKEDLDIIFGNNYQKKAQSLLAENKTYRDNLVKKRDIPKALLFKEIDPVLSAISETSSVGADNKINEVISFVNNSGIVTKIRLQILKF